ncbi:GntR family transcriptional regulator [Spirillospora sp. NPDC048824]|uniref:GntR family transcriptional regulator n=1 Tax=Spirillospora sp. NPDC048824 TaxID=3364526 RepID=UPI00371BA6A4
MAGTASPSAGARAGGSKPNLYEVIRDQLIGEIESGRYPSGALLPSVRELTARMAISTTTARKALAEVVAAGYARPEGTRGHVSAGPRAQQVDEETPQPTEAPAAARPSGLAIRTPVTVTSDGYAESETEHTTLDVRSEPVPPAVALALGIDEPTAPVVVRRRLVADEHGMPTELRTSYLEPGFAQATPLAEPEQVRGSWGDALLASAGGKSLGTTQRHVSARHPSDSESAMLGLKPTACVLTRTETTHDQSGRPIDHTVTVWPAESTRLNLSDER